MYKEKVTPTENHGMLAFLAAIAVILIYIIGFGIIGMVGSEFKWILQLLVFAAITYVIYFMYTRLLGDYCYTIDEGVLYCTAQTGSRVRKIASLNASDLETIGDYDKTASGDKVYKAVKSLSKKNVKTAVFITDGKRYVLHFEPTDKLIKQLTEN